MAEFNDPGDARDAARGVTGAHMLVCPHACMLAGTCLHILGASSVCVCVCLYAELFGPAAPGSGQGAGDCGGVRRSSIRARHLACAPRGLVALQEMPGDTEIIRQNFVRFQGQSIACCAA